MAGKIIVAIPHSHSWFWTSTCVAALKRNPPQADGHDVEIVVVDNSPWSPAIRGICDTALSEGVTIIPNHKNNKFHASALDCIVDDYQFDYLMTLETDVLALKPGWLQWFFDQMRSNDYAVGMWHHEQFVNPSCTLYRGSVLRAMNGWCKTYLDPNVLRWGPLFGKSQPITERKPERDYQGWYDDNVSWIAGPFAEKRGWPAGTDLYEKPSGQDKGPGWYEPGQQLHHYAVENGYTYTICPSLTTTVDNVPVQTMYGAWGEAERGASYPQGARLGCGEKGYDHGRQLEAFEMFGNAQTAHLWGGTRALDILKHEVTCGFVKANTPAWLAREARFWRQVVLVNIQVQILDLIRKYGWHITGQGSDHISGRDKEAAEYVRACYKNGGVEW